ncbi:carboxypeptidase regulatory-like domain-containing protein [candidate division KSB1 bacterium]|nr:carboxypeptidase regulatory-like domain-containing protein [candidate division KSB1 bacterium]
MVRRISRTFFLISFVILWASISVRAEWLSLPANVGGTEPVARVVSSDETGLVVEAQIPGVGVESFRVDGEDFTVLELGREGSLIEVGKPELPVVTRLIAIPPRAGVRIKNVVVHHTVERGFRIFPAQSPDFKEGDPLIINYSEDAFYPSETVRMGDPAILRDLRVVPLTFYPFQVNPSTGEIRFNHTLRVELEFSGTSTVNEKERVRPRYSESFAKLYRNVVLNYEPSAVDEETEKGSYLFICPDQPDLLNAIQPLVDWKRKKGHSVVVERFPFGTSYYIIKSFIQQAYDSWESPPEFIVLVGDASSSQVGSYSVPAANSTSDHPYVQLEGGDILADAFVGRLSVNSLGELLTIVNKILYYEKTPYMGQTGWYKRAVLVAGSSHSGTSTIHTKRYVKQRMLTHGYSRVDTLWYTMGGSVPDFIRNAINNGVGFFNYRGWLGMEGFGNDDIAMLTNGFMLPVVTIITCGTGDFVGSGADQSEYFVRVGSPYTPKGAVACIGSATLSTHTRFNNCLDMGIYYGIFDEELYAIGAALFRGKLALYLNCPTDPGAVTDYSYWNNLMGDPGLQVWTDIPQPLGVAHPPAVPAGSNTLTLTVTDQGAPLEDAHICLMKEEDGIYARGLTSQDGQLALNFNPVSAGTLWVTVTKHNFIPYLGQAMVVDSDLFLGYWAQSVDDDSLGESMGNGDGVLQAGETVELVVWLKNFGAQDSSGEVSAVLGTTSPWVTLIDTVETYGGLGPGDSAACADDFDFIISPSCPNGYQLPFDLTINDADCTWVSALEIPVFAPELRVGGHTFIGGGGTLDPGEVLELTVTVANQGPVGVSSVTGRLLSQDPFVTIPDPIGVFGAIPSGGVATNTQDHFQVAANALTIRGHQTTLFISLAAEGGFSDTVSFSIQVGTVGQQDPLGPDSYGYYAFDNTDSDYEVAPEYQWIEIDPNYGGVGSLIPLSDYGNEQDDVEIVDLPFPFQYYGHRYTRVSICSNGWLAMGSCSIPFFRNWGIPGAPGPDGMIAPFWDDLELGGGGVYCYHDPVNNWFVVEWSRVRTEYSNDLETFEVILYNPVSYPTPSGDGDILFQYETVNDVPGRYSDNDYATVGIESPSQADGLEYSYFHVRPLTASPLIAGRAIKFTTEINFLRGALRGRVTDLETGEPLPRARVRALGDVYFGITDSSGFYFIPDLLVKNYQFEAHLEGYNPLIQGVEITVDDTAALDFALTHPEVWVDSDSLTMVLAQGQSQEVAFTLSNPGNGPLEYRVGVHFQPDTGGAAGIPWDQEFSFDGGSPTGDGRLLGAAFVGKKFYVSGANNSAQPNYVYIFDLDGNYLDFFEQPGGSAGWGFRDLAWDGEYLYGSFGSTLTVFDTLGNFIGEIPSPVHPARAIAYDPGMDHFWVSGVNTDIYVIDRSGTVLRQYPSNLRIYGLGWQPEDEEGFNLYVFSKDGGDPGLQVSKMDTSTGEIRVVTHLAGFSGEHAGGAEITDEWAHSRWVMVVIIQASSDRVEGYHAGYHMDWISVSPRDGILPGGESHPIQVNFDTENWGVGEYRAQIRISHNALGDTVVIPVRLTITPVGVDEGDGHALPKVFTLGQNYPNPFNPETVIRYQIPVPSHVSLKIYNILGQEVAVLVEKDKAPGYYRVRWDGTVWPSGVYFCRMKARDFTQNRKLLLIK